MKNQNKTKYPFSRGIALSVIMVNLLMGCDAETPSEIPTDQLITEQIDAMQPTQTEESTTDEPIKKESVQVDSESKLHFIHTGNSDAILIENSGKFAMIDTGDTDDDATIKAYLQKQGVATLDYLILTHYHADHIGGADTIISDFEVKTTLVPNGDATTKVYRDYIDALSAKGLKPSVPLENSTFELGQATLTLYNTTGGSSNENNNSLVVLYEHGEDRALFTGDAEAEVEETLNIGAIDLLKVGHHGSSSSSSSTFIQQLDPSYAVLLVGQPNQYGHPHQEVLELFKSKNIPVYRTDEQGDLVFISTGRGIKTSQTPGSYQPGSEATSHTESSDQDDTSPSTSTSNSSTTGSSNYKDDNPNGVYTQESSAIKESYKNCTLLREVYPSGVPEGHPAYESKHDRDRDGWACER